MQPSPSLCELPIKCTENFISTTESSSTIMPDFKDQSNCISYMVTLAISVFVIICLCVVILKLRYETHVAEEIHENF